MSAASTKIPRRDRDRANAPTMRAPPPLKAGERMRLLRQVPREDTAQAIARAKKMTWWPSVVLERPSWSGGFWIFIARATP